MIEQLIQVGTANISVTICVAIASFVIAVQVLRWLDWRAEFDFKKFMKEAQPRDKAIYLSARIIAIAILLSAAISKGI